MAGLGVFIAAMLFIGLYWIILQAGSKVIDKGVDKTVDTAIKTSKFISKTSKPTIDNISNRIQKVKNAVFKPNTFQEDWTLEEFSKLYGPHARILSHINNTTKKVFHTCEIYNDEGKICSIRFSASLGELSLQELKDRKSKLFIGKTNNGRYYLYDEYYKDWETVELNFT